MNSFTLVELLIIMSILGILSLIGIPAFKIYQPSLQLSGSVRELVTDLRYAEQLAVTEQVGHGIIFLIGTDEYQIVRFGDKNEVIESKTLPQDISFSGITGFTDNEAIFNPYGAAEESGIITLVNTKNSTSGIDVRPSGFIKVIK
ncbi:MAG: hypothetical protein ABIB55_00185 [Candidatus Nealsonbacteria bacterium]